MNTENLTPITWREVRAGDVLLHDNGDRLTVKAVEYEMEMPPTIRAVNLRLYGEGWERSGFAPYRKQSELPTEPGAYADKDGHYWLIGKDGSWYTWSRRRQLEFFPDEPYAYAPFTRLVPMPSRDAVMEVVKGIIPLSRYETVTDAVMALLTGDKQEVGS